MLTLALILIGFFVLPEWIHWIISLFHVKHKRKGKFTRKRKPKANKK